MLFDAHLHLRDDRLWPFREHYLSAMVQAKINGYLDCASHPNEWARDIQPPPTLQGFTAYGIHPWHANLCTHEMLQRLECYLQQHPQSCIGEIGLDGIRPINGAERKQQLDCFIAQLKLAIAYQRPVILHGARAWTALFDTLLPYAKRLPALHLHGVSFAPECLQHPLFKSHNNTFFSVNTLLFQSSAKTIHRLLPHLPPKRLLIESDAPDFLPHNAEPLLPNTTLQHPKHLLKLKTIIHAAFPKENLDFFPKFLLF